MSFSSNWIIHFQGDQPWLDNGHYWDDFFLLKVNSKYLLEEVERIYIEKPAVLKVFYSLNVNHIFDWINKYSLNWMQYLINALFLSIQHIVFDNWMLIMYVRWSINDIFIGFILDNLCSYLCDKSCQSKNWFWSSGIRFSLW